LALAEGALPTLIWASLIGNVLPDFVSLLATRAALRFLTRNDTASRTFFILLADLVITAGLALLASRLALWVTVDWHFWHATPEIQAFHAANPNVSVDEALRDFALDPSIKGLYAAAFVTKSFVLLWIIPAFFTSIWLWLYAGSGFLLKAARRFDIGFEWFNNRFDIEKKPLQAIGLVAGTLVCCVYWTFAIVHRLLIANWLKR